MGSCLTRTGCVQWHRVGHKRSGTGDSKDGTAWEWSRSEHTKSNPGSSRRLLGNLGKSKAGKKGIPNTETGSRVRVHTGSCPVAGVRVQPCFTTTRQGGITQEGSGSARQDSPLLTVT